MRYGNNYVMETGPASIMQCRKKNNFCMVLGIDKETIIVQNRILHGGTINHGIVELTFQPGFSNHGSIVKRFSQSPQQQLLGGRNRTIVGTPGAEGHSICQKTPSYIPASVAYIPRQHVPSLQWQLPVQSHMCLGYLLRHLVSSLMMWNHPDLIILLQSLPV